MDPQVIKDGRQSFIRIYEFSFWDFGVQQVLNGVFMESRLLRPSYAYYLSLAFGLYASPFAFHSFQPRQDLAFEGVFWWAFPISNWSRLVAFSYYRQVIGKSEPSEIEMEWFTIQE